MGTPVDADGCPIDSGQNYECCNLDENSKNYWLSNVDSSDLYDGEQYYAVHMGSLTLNRIDSSCEDYDDYEHLDVSGRHAYYYVHIITNRGDEIIWGHKEVQDCNFACTIGFNSSSFKEMIGTTVNKEYLSNMIVQGPYSDGNGYLKKTYDSREEYGSGWSPSSVTASGIGEQVEYYLSPELTNHTNAITGSISSVVSSLDALASEQTQANMAITGRLDEIKTAIQSSSNSGGIGGSGSGLTQSQITQSFENALDKDQAISAQTSLSDYTPDLSTLKGEITNQEMIDGFGVDLSGDLPGTTISEQSWMSSFLENNPFRSAVENSQIDIVDPVCSIEVDIVGVGPVSLSMCDLQSELNAFGSIILSITSFTSLVMVLRR